MREEGRYSAHMVDEWVGMKEHIEAVKFYAQLIVIGREMWGSGKGNKHIFLGMLF